MSTPRKKRKLQKSGDSVVDICGVQLQRFRPDRSLSSGIFQQLQMVPSAVEVIRQMAVGVGMGRPVLAVGPVGSGKTSAIEWLARRVGRTEPNDFVKIQLSDDMDGKILFGFYRSTEIPSEFVWIPGLLTKALLDGSWVLLEDLDSAPNDVLCSLISIIERHEITIAGRGKVKADRNFRLFVTLRTKAHGGAALDHSKSFILDKPWQTVAFESFSKLEMRQILEERYPQLTQFAERLLSIFDCVQQVQQDNHSEGRYVSLRDFLKWCHRLSCLSNLDDMAQIYQESFECFGAHLLSFEGQKQIGLVLVQNLNLNVETLDYYMTKHKPDISMEGVRFKLGRCQFERPRVSDSRDNFALTRPAAILLERIAVCVRAKEPVLLVGETGCGKTATVQILAKYSGRRLHVVNLNQQSETGDLMGGMKPVDFRYLLTPLKVEFDAAFDATFSHERNLKFLQNFQNCWAKGRWKEVLQLMAHIATKAVEKEPTATWATIGAKVKRMVTVVSKTREALAFGFVEGILTKAVRNGDWILLDEINLATPETLDCLYSLLDSYVGDGNFVGDLSGGDPVKISPDFRLFACMNPATDVGKRQLTPGIRSRFTEFAVGDVESEEDLTLLVLSYLEELSVSPAQIGKIIRLYKTLRFGSLKLTSDSWGHQPNFSLRTFCRALHLAQLNAYKNVTRSLYEAFCLSFLTELDAPSHAVVLKLIQELIVGSSAKVKRMLIEATNPPRTGNFRKVEGFWLECGSEPVESDRQYVMTETVRSNARDLSRAVAAQLHPVLLQGETSVGKTSLIKHLAKLTGNRCVRINNHEHTDIQEYFGSYCADANGKLTFVEGPLVQAIRKGHWVVLDELNLAPPEVLESLNRLLDDNRELFIPETQQIVKPNPKFILFATQNPPGLYSGRKQLSRAFRNRFIELHFNELPFDEIETILQHRCNVPASYAKKMVQSMQDLQIYRNTAGVFAGKESYMTLRDLFRWGERYAKEVRDEGTYFDWDQYLADQGFLLLAGRVRRRQDQDIVVRVIEKRFARKIDITRMFAESSPYLTMATSVQLDGFGHICWTENLRRQAVLLGQALKFDEPSLLIGETGCGKTTLCQMFAQLQRRQLLTVNCHLMTEASDFLGKLKPASSEQMERGVLFEWYDGPLVVAMQSGLPLMIDEISLADDSVLERLNSVLEPERILLLAEKGVDPTTTDEQHITASKGFTVMATMNPGGDYGKKELSKALRNRFTEIWCDSNHGAADLMRIVDRSIETDITLARDEMGHTAVSRVMIDFIRWLSDQQPFNRRAITIRDIVSWVGFINRSRNSLEWPMALIHGAALVLLEGTAGLTVEDKPLRTHCVRRLCHQVSIASGTLVEPNSIDGINGKLTTVGEQMGVTPFLIPIGPTPIRPVSFTFRTPSCIDNVYRILRALQVTKPILLEGPPGVGKSSIVAALANTSGHTLTRINLSEQTDISDLFGSDLPTVLPNGQQGFAWNDGILLTALKEGHWVLLDEMNLASQAVLEGLNACFDHRGEVSIPELGKVFHVDHKRTRFFATQNPLQQGEGRKGLPKSLINRFSVVFMDVLSEADQFLILSTAFPEIPSDLLEKMIRFNMQLKISVEKEFRSAGSSWEFNLRDAFRWCEMMLKNQRPTEFQPSAFLNLLYTNRLRSATDRAIVYRLYETTFGQAIVQQLMEFSITPTHLQVSKCVLRRFKPSGDHWEYLNRHNVRLLPSMFPVLESLMHCVDMNWLAIVVGAPGVGKTTSVHSLAALLGKRLSVVQMTTETDASELVGSFEQITRDFYLNQLGERLAIVTDLLPESGNELISPSSSKVAKLWQKVKGMGSDPEGQLVVIARLIEKLKSVGANVTELELGLKNLEEIGSSVRFEWVDSTLVEAVKEGHWVVMENVNFCSAAVLDRLNGFLEPGGTLTISERGLVDGQMIRIQPHPNFRLFFTMDPRHGEISRPMRNRGVEIFIAEDTSWSKSLRETVSLMKPLGLNNDQIACLMENQDGKFPYRLIQSAVLASWKKAEIFSPVISVQESLDGVITPQQSISPPVDMLMSQLMLKESSWELWRNCALLEALSDQIAQRMFASMLIMLKSSSVNLDENLAVIQQRNGSQNAVMREIHRRSSKISIASSDDYLPVDQRWNCGADLCLLAPDRNWHLVVCRLIQLVNSAIPSDQPVKGVGKLKRTLTSLSNNFVKFFSAFVTQLDQLTQTNANSMNDRELMLYLTGLMYLRQLRIASCQQLEESGMVQLSVLWCWTEKYLFRLLNDNSNDELTKLIGAVSKMLRYDKAELKRFRALNKQLLTFLKLPRSSVNAALRMFERLAKKLNEFANDSDSLNNSTLARWREMKAAVFQLLHSKNDTAALEAISDRLDGLKNTSSDTIKDESEDQVMPTVQLWSLTAVGSVALQGSLLLEPAVTEQWWNVANYVVNFMKSFSSTVWASGYSGSCSYAARHIAFFDLLDSREGGEIHLSNWQLTQTSSVTEALQKLNWREDFSSVSIGDLKCSLAAATRAVGYLWAQGDFVSNFNESIAGCLQQAITQLNDQVAAGLGLKSATSRSDLWDQFFTTGISVLHRIGTVPTVDPLSETTWKSTMLREQKAQLSCELDVIRTEMSVAFSQSVTDDQLLHHPHPLVRFLIDRRSVIERKLARLDEQIDLCGFSSDSNVTDNYFSQPALRSNQQYVALRGEIEDLLQLCDSVVQLARNPIVLGDINSVQSQLAQLSNWSVSVTYLLQRLNTDYSSFLDITGPYIFAAKLVLFGVNLLCGHLEGIQMKFQVQIPSLDWSKVESNFCGMAEVPSTTLTIVKDVQFGDTEHRLFGTDYIIRYAEWVLKGGCTFTKDSIKPSVKKIFEWLCAKWTDQQKPESDRYYEYKSKNEGLSDDELDLKEMQQRFPDYSGWFHNENPEAIEETTTLSGFFVKESDVYPFWKLLESLLKRESLTTSELIHKVAERLELRLHLGNYWVSKFIAAMGNRDGQLLGANLMSLKQFIRSLQSTSDQTSSDVYKCGDMSAAIRCKRLLEELLAAVGNLLLQWPDHPALMQVGISVRRLTGLPVKTPLMKLAAAVEDLLRDCEQWETVAASFVSLKAQIMPLRELLLEWRKREVLSWNSLLDDVESDQLQSAAIFGLELMDAVNSSMEQPDKIEELLETVKQFIEFSPIGQFRQRLVMLRLLVYVLGEEECSTVVQNRLVNLYNFYSIFAEVVETHKSNKRAPVEKELKDFVKIVKFNDLNFCSMQASAQKSHRHLFKFVKRYKAALDETVNPLLGNLVKSPSVQFDNRMVEWSQPQNILATTVNTDVTLLNYYDRLSRFCAELTTARIHGDFFSDVTELIGLANDMLNSFAKQIVYEGTDEEKEKQFRVAMNKKQNLWTDFFKSLQSEGFSFKKGVQFFVDKADRHFFDGPVRIENGVMCDDQLMSNEFFIAVQYAMYFHSACQKPNPQVNAASVQKMTGYVGIFMATAIEQRNRLIRCQEQSGELNSLRYQLSLVVSDLKQFGHVPDQVVAASKVKQFTVALEQSVVMMSETKKLLECCPPRIHLAEHLLDFVTERSPPVCAMASDDQQFIDLIHSVGEIIKFLADCYISLIAEKDTGYICWSRITKLSNIVGDIQKFAVVDKLQLMMTVLEGDRKNVSFCGKGIESTVELMRNLVNTELSTETFATKVVDNSDSGEDELIKRILLSVQSIYKVSTNDEMDVYKYLVHMNDAIDRLKIADVISCASDLRDEILSGRLPSVSQMTNDCAFLVSFDQLLDFYNRQCSEAHRILCGAATKVAGSFISLLQSGYVNPVPQIDNSSDGSGSKKFEDCEGTGMGEGQGAKDVSDEIEDLGQIEGTQGEEKNESDQPDKPPPEGKNPIDLDEDIFDGDLEDVKLDENESEDKDNGDEDDKKDNLDADQKMGDVEESQDDQLDPHMWDEEKEESPEDRKLDEEVNGADQKQNKMVAKDNEEDKSNPPDSAELDENNIGSEAAEAEKDESQQEGEPQDATDDVHLENLCLDGDEPDGSESEDDNADGAERTQDDQLSEGETAEDETKLEEILDEDSEKPEEKSDSEVTLSKTGGGGEIQLDSQGGDKGADDQSKENRENQQQLNEADQETTDDMDKMTVAEEDPTANSGGAKDSNAKLVESTGGDQLMPRNKDKRTNPGHEPTANKRTKTHDADRTRGSVNQQTLSNKLEVGRQNVQKEGSQDDQLPEHIDTVAHTKDADSSSLQITDSTSLEEAKGQSGEAPIEPIVLDSDEEMDESASVKQQKEKVELMAGGKNSSVTRGDRIDEENLGETNEDDLLTSETPSRDDTSTIHTALTFYDQACQSLAMVDIGGNNDDLPLKVENDEEGRRLWAHYQNVTQPLASELTENLRLILEPTLSSKLQGDYRTGKRLNIRKLIPYIASNFRKNKIWLRRTKKSKRDYQVLMAIDDSASMSDNQSKQMAFEAVTLLSSTLAQLEVGNLAICKFGETAQLLHGFQDAFSDEIGAHVLSHLSFEQKGTSIVKLMELTCSSFQQQSTSSVTELPARLLLIISDGRGVFAEGTDRVMSAVKLALAQKVFLVFIILDNPHSQDSILDIKVPVFGENNTISDIKSYMELFPFPFYMILRQIGSLPAVVGEALRQWFEIVTSRT